ncbi:MAG TPA: cytidine deaminase [Actinomycetota bacterium]|nr:cytidine deaminase [Actinomycetota bacterium]
MTRLPPELQERLIVAAREIRARAYVPYSGFRVGAAVLAGGEIFTGVNVENASYPVSTCAERSAIVHAVTAGHTKIDAVAVVADAEDPTTPCGMCRQALNEFGPEMLVICEGTGGTQRAWVLSSLLQDAFGPANLPG